jgi:hypothetical protein
LVGQGMPAKREPVPEPLHYTPSAGAALAAQQGKRGFVLLR